MIARVMASRTASAPCPASAGPFLVRGPPPWPAMRGRWSRIVNRVVRSTRVPMAELPNPASAGRWLIRISGAMQDLPRPRLRARGTRSARPVRRQAVSSRRSAPPPRVVDQAPEGRDTMNPARLWERALGMREGQRVPGGGHGKSMSNDGRGRQPPTCVLEEGQADLLSFRVDPNDRILPAVGQPRGPVWPLNDAVWRRTLAEGNVARAAGLRIEDAESPDLLGRVPDLAIRRRRDIVRVGAFGKLVDLPLRGLVLCSAGER